MSGFPNASLLVTPSALAAELGLGRSESLVPSPESRRARPLLLDLRPAEHFAAGHVPGAVHLDLWGVSLIDTDPAPMRAFMWMIVHMLELRGIDAGRPVVVYDEQSGLRAARAFWFLEYFGHPSVRLLDGGYGAWTREGLPVASFAPRAAGEARGAERGDGAPASDAPGGVQGSPPILKEKADWLSGEPPQVADRVATWRDVRDCLGRPGVVLLDTRTDGEYCGTLVRAKRGGAVPGAVHIEWTRNLGPDGAFKPAAELRAMYEQAGVTPDKEVITYCHGGYRAAHSYLALRLLGYPRVRNYIGSWKEWGDREDLPLEKPERQ